MFFYVHTPSHYSPPLMMNTKCELSVPLFSVKYIYLFGTGELFRQSFGAPIDVKQYYNHFECSKACSHVKVNKKFNYPKTYTCIPFQLHLICILYLIKVVLQIEYFHVLVCQKLHLPNCYLLIH